MGLVVKGRRLADAGLVVGADRAAAAALAAAPVGLSPARRVPDRDAMDAAPASETRGQARCEESGFSRMPRTATGATMELREARIASRTKLHQEDCRKNPPKVFLVKRTKANSAPRRFREPAKAGSLFYGSALRGHRFSRKAR